MGELNYTWFREERGIAERTLNAFGVVVSEGLAKFPMDGGYKCRRHDADGKRHFFAEGPITGLFKGPGLGTENLNREAFLVEGETDALRLWQEYGPLDVYALPGINWWNPELVPLFDEYDVVHVILDNDEDYKTAGVVDDAWSKIRRDLRGKARRVVLPQSPVRVKDICEFFDNYDGEFLDDLLDKAVTHGPFVYEALDLTMPAPPIDWLVEGMVARKDVNVFIGEPGLGKSWLMMDLAVAAVVGGRSWLGRSLHLPKNPKILYVDEENPEDVVRTRLEQLGLTHAKAPQIRYLHHQAIRLDKWPERLLDEAYAWEPDITFLDSLTRLHTEDENNAGAMSKVFNDGIMPLSRDVGSTVFVLHHVGKGDGASSFGRSRGSGDITASPDAAFDVRGASNRMFVTNFKSRRKISAATITASILDVRDGVEVVASDRVLV